jgi:signal transduction histidine kinase
MNEWASGNMNEASTSRASRGLVEELLEFERLLFELSVRFADVSADRVVAEIESALLGLVNFLDFDRGAFWEFLDEEQQQFLCTVAVEGVVPPRRGAVPVELAWFAKELRAGRTVVIRSDRDVPAEAASAAEYNNGEAQKKGIALQSELSEGLPPVFGNRTQLQQVMLNLFSNAIEAMDSAVNGSRRLHVSSTSFAPETVLITVTDSGPGLPIEDINRIFDPFFTTKSQGMGMGLSICRSLVEAHNGQLSARSGAKQGAVFEITLPAGDLGQLLETA